MSLVADWSELWKALPSMFCHIPRFSSSVSPSWEGKYSWHNNLYNRSFQSLNSVTLIYFGVPCFFLNLGNHLDGKEIFICQHSYYNNPDTCNAELAIVQAICPRKYDCCPPFSSFEIMSGVSELGLPAPRQLLTCWSTLSRGHQDSQRPAVYVLWGEAETTGFVQLGLREGEGKILLQSYRYLRKKQRKDGGTMSVIKHQKQFPKSALESPSLETVRTHLPGGHTLSRSLDEMTSRCYFQTKLLSSSLIFFFFNPSTL